jgi:hypothetical protein
VAGETTAMAVALAGTRLMADRGVRATVFEPPRPQRARGRFGAAHEYASGYGPASYGFGGLGGGGVGTFGGGFCGDGGSGGGGDGGGC